MSFYLMLFCWSLFGQYLSVIGEHRGDAQTYVVVGLHSANWKEEWKYAYESFQYIQGVFEKSKEGDHYYKLGQSINETQYYLYHVTIGNTGFWVLGGTHYYQHGGYKLAEAVVRSRGSLAMGPSENGWEWVLGGIHDGRTQKYNPLRQIQSAPSQVPQLTWL